MDKVEMIKNSINMTDIVNHYAPRKIFRGRCACPLHGGTNQNFKVYADSFYCFKCGSGGDLIKFVSLYFGISYADAINKVGLDFNLFGETDVAKLNNNQRLANEKRLKQERTKELEAYSERQKSLLTEFRYSIGKTGKYREELERLDNLLDNIGDDLILTSADELIRKEVMRWN